MSADHRKPTNGLTAPQRGTPPPPLLKGWVRAALPGSAGGDRSLTSHDQETAQGLFPLHKSTGRRVSNGGEGWSPTPNKEAQGSGAGGSGQGISALPGLFSFFNKKHPGANKAVC